MSTPLSILAETIAGHIRKPMTLSEITTELSGLEYNAELILQHLILWAAQAEQVIEDAHGSLVLARMASALGKPATHDDLGTAIDCIEKFLTPEPK